MRGQDSLNASNSSAYEWTHSTSGPKSSSDNASSVNHSNSQDPHWQQTSNQSSTSQSSGWGPSHSKSSSDLNQSQSGNQVSLHSLSSGTPSSDKLMSSGGMVAMNEIQRRTSKMDIFPLHQMSDSGHPLVPVLQTLMSVPSGGGSVDGVDVSDMLVRRVASVPNPSDNSPRSSVSEISPNAPAYQGTLSTPSSAPRAPPMHAQHSTSCAASDDEIIFPPASLLPAAPGGDATGQPPSPSTSIASSAVSTASGISRHDRTTPRSKSYNDKESGKDKSARDGIFSSRSSHSSSHSSRRRIQEMSRATSGGSRERDQGSSFTETEV
jgi:hypothetical protein